MIEIVNGKVNLKTLEIEDVIDISALQKFLDNFAIGMNCAAVSVNRAGEEVTRPSYYRPFCADFIHSTALGDSRCAKCHNEMGEESIRIGKPYISKCHAGLIDFAAPIIIDGEHLGTVLGGQILEEPMSDREVSKVAADLHLPEDRLLNAAKKIDLVDSKNIEAAAEVLFIVANTMAMDGYKRIEIEILSKNLASNFYEISQTVELLAESAQTITGNQHDLTNEISEIGSLTKEINQVLDFITKVANKTKLIGLNSSIEAARLGNAGRGFTIVSGEIQKLSEDTKNTTLQINKLNNAINEKIGTTEHNSEKTLASIEDQSAAMEELSATVQSSLDIANRLKNLITDSK
ncbi:MAG: PocR ligand-binding domain-containing protein [Lachnospiraceae bacterium]|nr:PocR ligand-binding domain-containing protein [Lachnospiraceae bacterium]